MNIVVTGAQFNNKGAQSLLFSLMTEMNKRFTNLKVFYVPLDWHEDYLSGLYKFIPVFDDKAYLDITDSRGRVKRWIKTALDHRMRTKRVVKLSRIWGECDLLFDIGGYQLTSDLSINGNYRLMRYINTAKDNGLKVYLLPQSFGPFNYNDGNIDALIKSTLRRADLIFAREREGKRLLDEVYGVHENVEASPDLVLQSDEDPDSVLRNPSYRAKYRSLQTENNVCIIPNEQTILHGNKSNIYAIYRDVISELLRENKTVYICRHSDDLRMCRDIYTMFIRNENVHLIEDSMDCFAFTDFIAQFDYIIASRFHSVVHAYRQGVPAIVLGWASKYEELASDFAQEKFVFDLTDIRNSERIVHAVKELSMNHRLESEVILHQLVKMKENNCIDMCLRNTNKEW